MKLLVFLGLLLCLLLALYPSSSSADQLAIVKSMSSTRKSFVINKGLNDGVRLKQRRAFTTDKISIVCEAVEVAPETSLWQVYDKNAIAPFNKEQIVFFTTTTESLWTAIIEADQREKESMRTLYLYNLRGQSWLARAGITRTTFNTVSQAPSNQNNVRGGMHFEILRDYRVQGTQVNLAAGLRYDRERELIQDVGATVEATRTMITGEITYHFPRMQNYEKNFYGTVGLAIGKAKSEIIGSATKEGMAYAFPIFRLGLQNHLWENYFLLVELCGEGVYVRETFANSVEQSNTLINTKFNIGLRF
jgi:hypothetical protein